MDKTASTSSAVQAPTRKRTLNPVVRRAFIEQYVPDKQEWKACAKMIRFMILSKASLFAMRNFMYKCWLEDTSLDTCFRLVLNNGKGLALMMPDQIVFEVFRLVKPEEVRLCGHFHCEQQRLETLMNSLNNSVTGLEVYGLTSAENAHWLLKRCARQIKYLACEVADLADFLRSPIQLDHFLAYHRHSVDSALSWIFKAIDAKAIDLGIKPFVEFPLSFDGPVRKRLESLTLIGVVSRRNEIFEFFSAFKSKAPNLAKLEMNFYCRQSEHTAWSTFLSGFIEFARRLQTCVREMILNINIAFTEHVSPLESNFYGYPIETKQNINEFGQTDVKTALVEIPINLNFVAREASGFCFEDV